MVFTPIYLHGLLLIYQPQRDGRLSWQSWLTHSRKSYHLSTIYQLQVRESLTAKDQRPNNWATLLTKDFTTTNQSSIRIVSGNEVGRCIDVSRYVGWDNAASQWRTWSSVTTPNNAGDARLCVVSQCPAACRVAGFKHCRHCNRRSIILSACALVSISCSRLVE